MNFKCALITGASSGIGAATARKLSEAGLDVILVARREDRLQTLARELKTKAHIIVADITSPQGLAAISAHPELLNVDVLVNNAGLARGTDKFQNISEADLDEMMATNVTALMKVTRIVVPHMLRKERGHIVNLGSVAGRWVYPGGAVYCAAKFAVRALSEGLRMDLHGTPLRVTNIEPGMVETEFSNVRFKDDAKAKAVYRGMTPLSPEDIAETIAWSLSRPAHVTIQEMVIFPTDQSAIREVHRKDI